MKKILFLIIIAITAVFAVSAFGKKENSKPAENIHGYSDVSSGLNGSVTDTVPKEFKGSLPEEAEITGLVERGFENRISIVVNPSSKSRLSYYPDEKAAEELEKMLGQTVTVAGKVKETGSPFKKEIKVTEIKK